MVAVEIGSASAALFFDAALAGVFDATARDGAVLAGAFFTTGFFDAAFFATGFFVAAFFTAETLEEDALTVFFFAAGLAAVLRDTAFAAVFFATAFFAVVFLAAVFFAVAARVEDDFWTAGFLADGLRAVDFFLAGWAAAACLFFCATVLLAIVCRPLLGSRPAMTAPADSRGD